jgi:hypothetical protein
MTTHETLTADNLHRTAKYFMDSGRAASHGEAMVLLESFGLTVMIGPEIAVSRAKQTALLTLVNLAHRTLLGGVVVVGAPDCRTLTPLAPGMSLRDAVSAFGGSCEMGVPDNKPVALIGGVASASVPAWRLTWDGWRGGVVPAGGNVQFADDEDLPLAPMIAAACCVGEVFSCLAGDHAMAGRRAAGLSLWAPEADWLQADHDAPSVSYLPARLWLIGLGNLGQAFAWALASLPYANPSKVELMLQDFDRLATSNISTSLLTFADSVGEKKTRMTARWLEARGFTTMIEERRFGPWSKRTDSEPGVALCGVDNAAARAALEEAGFDLVIEAGLGAGPDGFRGLSLHTFPASRTARATWPATGSPSVPAAQMPAYAALAAGGMDECGLVTLASRTVGVPFVGLLAATLTIAELLRRLHRGKAYELLATSTYSLDDVATVQQAAPPYAYGHVVR